MAATSMGGRLPLSMFESPQTVGGVAQEMIRFYLLATDRWSLQLQRYPFDRGSDEVTSSLFDTYWTERSP
jgi:hypothetical protein